MNRNKFDELAEKAIQELVDSGKLVESGWHVVKQSWCPPDAPPEQISDMRTSFFLGASFLFDSIIRMLEPGEECTKNDENRMDAVEKELREFETQLKVKLAAKSFLRSGKKLQS